MVEESFPTDFGFEVLNELASDNSRRLFFPGAGHLGGRDGLNIRVIPSDAEAWIGTFSFGRFGSKAVTGVFATPNPKKLCVVAKGQAYIVNVISPQDHECLSIIPVLDVRASLKHGLLIFANHTELLAMGSNGVAWRTGRLAWDSLRLTSMTDEILYGVFWDIQTESEQSFSVNLADGTHVGGARVPI